MIEISVKEPENCQFCPENFSQKEEDF